MHYILIYIATSDDHHDRKIFEKVLPTISLNNQQLTSKQSWFVSVCISKHYMVRKVREKRERERECVCVREREWERKGSKETEVCWKDCMSSSGKDDNSLL